MIKTILLPVNFLLAFLCVSCSSKKSSQSKVDSSQYYLDQSLKNKEEHTCKINSVCFLKNYNHKVDSFSRFVYIDVEMLGSHFGIDLDDLEAKVIGEDGKQTNSWAYESFFLNKSGKKTESSPENNNSHYLHIGVVHPVGEKAKKIRLYYWGSFLCGDFAEIKNVYCEIQ